MRVRAKEIRRTRHRKEKRELAARQLAGTATATAPRVNASAAAKAAPARPARPAARKEKTEE